MDFVRRPGSLALSLALLAACGDGSTEGGSDAAAHMLDASARDGAVADAMPPAPDAASNPRDAERGQADAERDPPEAGDAQAGPLVDRTDPKLLELELDPKQLDADAADSLSVQYAQLDTRAAPLGRLVVFLPGATNAPRDWRDHGRALASFGFHVLIPHYDNRWSSNGTCDGQENSCGDDTRWEALVGEDTSSAIAIARGDSAEGRVITMLKHLVSASPAGDWGYYLAGDALAYDRTIIAGISHGAASAGMYAARRPFSRNVMHSSGPAGSGAADKLTPLSAWYGFAHTEDDAYDAITGAWQRVGLVGALTSVDGASAPYGDSHRLITSAESSYPHGSVCGSGPSPRDGAGNYLFEPAWRYLYGAPAR